MEKEKRQSYYNADHQKKYKEQIKSVTISFNTTKVEDVELLEFLQKQKDKTNYIKSLVKKDMTVEEKKQ